MKNIILFGENLSESLAEGETVRLKKEANDAGRDFFYVFYDQSKEEDFKVDQLVRFIKEVEKVAKNPQPFVLFIHCIDYPESSVRSIVENSHKDVAFVFTTDKSKGSIRKLLKDGQDKKHPLFNFWESF